MIGPKKFATLVVPRLCTEEEGDQDAGRDRDDVFVQKPA